VADGGPLCGAAEPALDDDAITPAFGVTDAHPLADDAGAQGGLEMIGIKGRLLEAEL
jgi:hypothetical protein